MLFDLARPLANQFILFNLFRYITFRSACASITALMLSLLFGPGTIRKLKEFQIGSSFARTARSHIRPRQVHRPWVVCSSTSASSFLRFFGPT